MIVFDLRCVGGHVFEAWFGSSGDYEDQRGRGLLSCPLCGDEGIEKAAMAPAVPAKGGRAGPMAPGDDAARAKMMLAALAKAQAKALETSSWVGRRFVDEARSMHLGDRPQAPIHGEATIAEAKALVEEGVPVAPLPLPVRAPETEN